MKNDKKIKALEVGGYGGFRERMRVFREIRMKGRRKGMGCSGQRP